MCGGVCAGGHSPLRCMCEEKKKEMRLRKKASALSVRELMDIAFMKGYQAQKESDADAGASSATASKASSSKDPSVASKGKARKDPESKAGEAEEHTGEDEAEVSPADCKEVEGTP